VPTVGTVGPVRDRRAPLLAFGVVALLAVIGLGIAWSTHQRLQQLEQELVRRQQESQDQAGEARLAAKQAQDLSRDAAAKVALLEARLAEVAVQRTQLDELISSLSRSRDENLLADVEASLRVALQQSAITGSPEPTVAALRQADERLARYNQPRLERVRRAIAKDLDRVKAVGLTDVAALTLRLDEAVRLVDELPLLTGAEARRDRRGGAAAAEPPLPPNPGLLSLDQPLGAWLLAQWRFISAAVGQEARSLLRITRIDSPDAMLVAPEQAWFIRENLKLRLLDARIALLSRQFDTAQGDLRDAGAALERYFDRGSRRVLSVAELLRQVGSQAKAVGVPRADETLAALTAAAAGR
jgi:uroporphyrin-3 C-methyltransferase